MKSTTPVLIASLSISLSLEAAAGSFDLDHAFWRSQQVQGSLFGLTLQTIPDFLINDVDIAYHQRLDGQGNPYPREIPFVDQFSINRFLGGERPDVITRQTTNHPNDVPPLTALGERSWDLAYKDAGGTIRWQDHIIPLRLQPYLDAGYTFDDITINIENAPYDLAVGGGDGSGPFGQRNPPAGITDTVSCPPCLEWQNFMWGFSYFLGQQHYPQAKNSGLRFKIGNEYDSTINFNGTEAEYYQMYRRSQEILRVQFPNADILSAEFTGNGNCDTSHPECVYNTGDFVATARNSGWKLDAVPRSYNDRYTGGTQNSRPSSAVDAIKSSYDDANRLLSPSQPKVSPEIHQFGVSVLDSLDPTRLISDLGARSVNWEFQVMMKLAEDLDIQWVSAWNTIKPYGTSGFLTGIGYVRNLLDRYLGHSVTPLPLTPSTIAAIPAASKTEIAAYYLQSQNGASRAIILSRYSDVPSSGNVNVRVNLNTVVSSSENLSGASFVSFNEDNNVFALIREQLVAANIPVLEPFNSDHSVVADWAHMVHPSDLSTVQALIFGNWQQNCYVPETNSTVPDNCYIHEMKKSLNFKPVSQVNPGHGDPLLYVVSGFDSSNNLPFVWVPMRNNELIVIELP